MKKVISLLLSTVLCASAVMPAFALEYDFESDVPGQTWYQATTAESQYIENSGDIIVGADGTIVNDQRGLVSSSPLSVLDLPAGEYPDAWGMATDVAIAQNSVFPNALAPTTQMSGLQGYAVYQPYAISSGALPTGQYTMGGLLFGGYSLASTSIVRMPSITKGGAIGKLDIPSIGLSKYVYDGTSQENMSKGIAHFDCTSGWDGNIALAGHNRPASWAAFARLHEVQMGDILTYTTAYGVRTYQVTNITTCATTDTSGLAQTGVNQITMYTCKANQPEVKLCVVATQIF